VATIDVDNLRDKIKAMYRAVAEEPNGAFHFEMGYELAARLGYPTDDLDAIPSESVESFAGVGYHLALAELQEGDRVVDLGSGSGTDAFIAARRVGTTGEIIGIDMTDQQLAKARGLAARHGYSNILLERSYIENTPIPDGWADVVISNGVINLCSDKAAVFREIARILRPGGRLAISDIVTASQLPDTVVCNADLWAACIGGAMQTDNYRREIESAGLQVKSVRDNAGYQFISANAKGAQQKWGVKSISVLAVKP
jgi:arsenite methyltransferase